MRDLNHFRVLASVLHNKLPEIHHECRRRFFTFNVRYVLTFLKCHGLPGSKTSLLSSCLTSFLITYYSLLIYFLAYLSSPSRTDPFHFQAGGRRRRPNLALVFFVLFLCCNIFCYGCMFAFVVFDLVFSVLSQEIGWKERLRDDLFCDGGT